ncbi:MAG: CARDB domain-containing protein [Candidatus Poseidoniales archaeon]
MLIGMNAHTNVGAVLENNISLESDITTSDILVGKAVTATLTLKSTDSSFQLMETYLLAQWTDPTINWAYDFWEDNNGVEIPLGSNPLIQMGQDTSRTIKLTVFCNADCSSGDTATMQLYGKTDPLWYDGGTESGQGYDYAGHPSTDGAGCAPLENCQDTTSAQRSLNTTNTVQITFTARSGAGSSLDCDDESNAGDNQMYQGTTYTWGYTLTNTGWDDDSYQFSMSILSDDSVTTDWSLDPGLSNGKQLTGQSDSSSTAVKKADGVMSIRPVDTARPGVYTITLTVSSNASPAPDDSTCSFDVVVPAPDLEIKNTDITFSHTGAWINTRGDSQKVTIFAKVRNNGGSIDSEGVTTSDIAVTFNVDGSQWGQSQTISSLAHGEEFTVQLDWNPSRPHEDDEVGIPVTVTVDTKGGESSISESDEENNEGTVYFKVVRTKASSPSFYVGFVSLIAAVGVAVLLSSYYRNKEDSD